MPQTKKTVFMAMSGGVDSSVSAALLLQEGYHVVGVFMKNWSEETPGTGVCTTEADFADVRSVCQHLGIPYYTFNFEEEYRKRVLDYFFSEYRAGRTPNPDVMCNKEIKFKLFFDRARDLGADLIATGHYAQVKEIKGKYELLKSKDSIKDQTYFIYNLDQAVLSKTLFPIGRYTKAQVRKLAVKFGLPNAQKKDSQGICFIGPVDVKEFLKTVIKPKRGDIVDLEGNKLGIHEGAWFYTIGQRRIAGLDGQPEPLYVVGTDIEKNLVIVGQDKDTYGKAVTLENFHWVGEKALGDLQAKSRYTPEFNSGILREQEGKWVFSFKKPERALTPGQSLVVYQGGICLGGGVISQVTK